MEFEVITMHITTQQMKGMFLLLDAVRVIAEIAACVGKAVSISVETSLTQRIFSMKCSSFCTEMNFESKMNIFLFHMIKFVSHSKEWRDPSETYIQSCTPLIPKCDDFITHKKTCIKVMFKPTQ